MKEEQVGEKIGEDKLVNYEYFKDCHGGEDSTSVPFHKAELVF